MVSCSILFTTCKPKNNDQINILWLSCEDISAYLSFYGDSTANTPVLDKLANESMVFTNVFSTVGVCAPSRSSLITGMYPTSIGTMHMRTGQDVFGWGKRNYNDFSEAMDINKDSIGLYSAVVPAEVKCFTEYLRANGYFCTNNAKTDYQFAAPATAWDENGREAHWKNAPNHVPFFSVFNHTVTHESQIWAKRDFPLTVNPDSVNLPPYFPDDSIVRTDVARCYSNIELLDKQIGKKLQELKEVGLYDKTIIFFFSDHGGPLPRGKREHYDSGLKVPFMVRLPNGINAGYYNQLISFVDVAPTVLSLAGIKPPDYMQGQAFLGAYKAKNNRTYIYGSGDRFDEFSDRIRMVRNDRFMYVRNFYPELPRYKDVAYRRQMPMMEELIKLNLDGQLNQVQARWFSSSKPAEELYDCYNDPHQLNNLVGNDEYNVHLAELKAIFRDHQQTYGDLGEIAERELLNRMWPNGKQPKTLKPIVSFNENTFSLSCSTNGASIAYLVSDSIIEPNLDSGWELYTKPVPIKKESFVYAMACRIGYADSEILKIEN